MKMTEIEKLAEKIGRTPTTVYRFLNGSRRVYPDDAKRLEMATAIPRLAWLYPEEFHNPMITPRGYSRIKAR